MVFFIMYYLEEVDCYVECVMVMDWGCIIVDDDVVFLKVMFVGDVLIFGFDDVVEVECVCIVVVWFSMVEVMIDGFVILFVVLDGDWLFLVIVCEFDVVGIFVCCVMGVLFILDDVFFVFIGCILCEVGEGMDVLDEVFVLEVVFVVFDDSMIGVCL